MNSKQCYKIDEYIVLVKISNSKNIDILAIHFNNSPPYSISTLVIQIIQHITHNSLLVQNVVSINNDGYHVISTSTGSK